MWSLERTALISRVQLFKIPSTLHILFGSSVEMTAETMYGVIRMSQSRYLVLMWKYGKYAIDESSVELVKDLRINNSDLSADDFSTSISVKRAETGNLPLYDT